MTTVEVPYSVAAALPTLSVFDITNEVSRAVSRAELKSGLAYIGATVPSSLIVSPSARRVSSATSRSCSPGSFRSRSSSGSA